MCKLIKINTLYKNIDMFYPGADHLVNLPWPHFYVTNIFFFTCNHHPHDCRQLYYDPSQCLMPLDLRHQLDDFQGIYNAGLLLKYRIFNLYSWMLTNFQPLFRIGVLRPFVTHCFNK